MLSQLYKIVDFLKNKNITNPDWGIIMGSGLSSLSNEIEIEQEIFYEDIPEFPQTTVEGHYGKLIYGNLSGKKILAFQGRFHYYEGYTMEQVTIPIRILNVFNVSNVIISNAAGGVNTSFKLGDIMLIKDHISFFTPNPLIGKNNLEEGLRFPDMTKVYSKPLINLFLSIAKKEKIEVKQGIYFGVTGPSYETPSEYKLIQKVGGDAVGMSTIPEAILARYFGMNILGISVITDMGINNYSIQTNHKDVQMVAQKKAFSISLILKQLIKKV